MGGTKQQPTGGPSEPSNATRETLIVTAIRLFADRGLLGVSLRAVGEAAGQRNTAAVHYHFGQREALLDAAIEHVVDAVREPVTHDDARSLGVAVSDPATPLEAAVASYFLPILTLPIRHPDWGLAGARLLSRIMLGEAAPLARELEAKTLADTAGIIATIAPLLPDVSEDLLRIRLDFASVSVVCGLAATAYLEALAASNASVTPDGVLADQLIAYVCGGLAAPVKS